MTARLEPGSHLAVTPQLQRVPRITARAVDQYLTAVGGRPNSVTIRRDRGAKAGLGFTFVTPVDLELRVQLATGDTLVVDALSYPVANLFGVPAFNRLQVRMSHLVRGRIAMIGGISHDVRTFLTRLRLRVDRIPDEEERERAAADIADMIRLLDDALLASRAGSGELTEELVDFAQVVTTEVDDRRLADKPVDLMAATPNTTVLGDRLALRRVVSNLIDNALIYGTVAHLTITADAEFVTLLVDDPTNASRFSNPSCAWKTRAIAAQVVPASDSL
jgi:signal transduction histidine kinase